MAAPHAERHSHPAEDHEAGIRVHVIIDLEQGVDVFAGYTAIRGVSAAGVTVGDLHLGLGEYDMIADLHAPWTDPRGNETRNAGEWINKARQLKDPSGRFYIKGTSTIVCMNT